MRVSVEELHDRGFLLVPAGRQRIEVYGLAVEPHFLLNPLVSLGLIGVNPVQLVRHAEIPAGLPEILDAFQRHILQVIGACTRKDSLYASLLETRQHAAGLRRRTSPIRIGVEADIVAEITRYARNL